MAEAVAVIGLAASIASLLDIGSRVVSRLHEVRLSGGHTSGVLQDIRNQLPLLLEIVRNFEARLNDSGLSPAAGDSLISTIAGCQRQISNIDASLVKWIPTPQESSLRRFRKALGAVSGEKKMMEALRILESYKSTLNMYSTSLLLPSSSEASDQIVYDLPATQISHFVGRQHILRQVTTILDDHSIKTVSPKVVVLLGMGGQGKTQIALEYCRRAQVSGTFSLVFWLDASSEKSLIRSYGDIAGKLAKNQTTFLKETARVSYVKNFLSQHNSNWLCVFDNFDRPDLFHNVKDYFPPGGKGAIIFTSRHPGAERLGVSIAVGEMAEPDALELLLQRSQQNSTEENLTDAKNIVSRLGYFPLAIDQAGSYLSSRRLPLKVFLEHYAQRKDVILTHTPALWEYRKNLSQREESTALTTFTTWEMSLEQLEDGQNRNSITHFLTLCAFLDCKNLRDSLFRNFAVSAKEPPSWLSFLLAGGYWDHYRFQDLIALLHSLSLIQSIDLRETDMKFTLHPLIKDWLRIRLPEDETRPYAQEAIQCISTSIRLIYNEETTFETQRMLVAQVDACMGNEAELSSKGYKTALYLWDDTASYFACLYNASGRYEDARLLYESILSHPSIAQCSLNLQTPMNLANTLRNQGNFQRAEEIYLKLFQERSKYLGENHLDTLRSLEGAAVIHCLQRKIQQAEKEYQQILQGRQEQLSTFDGDLLRAIEGLANVRRHQSRYGEAEALYCKALEVKFKILGPRSSDTCRCIDGLAIVYRHQGRLDEAVHLYNQILECFKQIFGDGHPCSLQTTLNLSIAYVYQGKDAEAEALADRAYLGFKNLHGSGHADTMRAADQLAEVRSLRASMFKHNLFHIGRQAASMYELIELRKISDANSSSPITKTNVSSKQDQLIQTSKMDTGGFIEKEVPQIPHRESYGPDETLGSISIRNECPQGLILLSDNNGRDQLASAASGHDIERCSGKESDWFNGDTIRTFAASGADFRAVVDSLLKNCGLGPDMKDKSGLTQLSRAAKDGAVDVAEFLLSRGDVDADSRCNYGRTPLMYACIGEHEEIMKLLLARHDVDINARDKRRQTPLICAAWHDKPRAANFLLNTNKADVNAEDDSRYTALTSAVEHGSIELVRVLLGVGAKQSKPTAIGSKEPLVNACFHGHEHIAKMLLANQSPSMEVANDAFYQSAASGNEEIIKILLATNLIDINKANEFGNTPLAAAALRRNHKICALLLRLGANPRPQDQDGKTALLKATCCRAQNIVELLLQNSKVDVDVADKDGRTPLYFAVKFGSEGMVKCLLDAGAEINLVELEALEKPKLLAAVETRSAALELVRQALRERDISNK